MAHQQELQRVLSEHALQHSVSRVTELQAKVDSQDVLIRHLRQQVSEADVAQEKLSVLRIREAGLETQIKQLSEELEEAKKSHAPVMSEKSFTRFGNGI